MNARNLFIFVCVFRLANDHFTLPLSLFLAPIRVLIAFFSFPFCFLTLDVEISFLWRWRLSGLGVGRNSFDVIGADINKAKVTHATGCEEYFWRRNSGKYSLNVAPKKFSNYEILCFVPQLRHQEDRLKESFAANKNDLKPVKSAISCIRFILMNATRYQTDDATLSAELQQLGLPKEHSTAMCRVFSESSGRIAQHLLDNSFTGKLMQHLCG